MTFYNVNICSVCKQNLFTMNIILHSRTVNKKSVCNTCLNAKPTPRKTHKKYPMQSKQNEDDCDWKFLCNAIAHELETNQNQ